MAGFATGYLPKFVRKYADLHGILNRAVGEYVADVRKGAFPDDAASYHLRPEDAGRVLRGLGIVKGAGKSGKERKRA
jgi:hypothetical protein